MNCRENQLNGSDLAKIQRIQLIIVSQYKKQMCWQ